VGLTILGRKPAMRIRMFLALLPLVLVTLPVCAQRNEGIPLDNAIPGPYPRGPRLPTADTPDPQFPLRVQLQFDYNQWNRTYGGYYGFGRFTFADQSTKEYTFDYGCNVSFLQPQTNQFQARWVKDGHKLEVLLNDPNKHKVHTCRLTTLASEPPMPARFR
jgi:hypothetical protein